MALLYSYLFPAMFLLAFWALYRYDQIPLIRHVGALLTISVLGGACFGLPTTMVGERERGVWRRYRLAPVSTGSLVASTVAARYVLLVLAGLLQIVLAMGLGMPLPRHPVELLVAFTFVAFAFLGVGLVIAMLADNVPAVQALGQCIFLPMLIVGGVAVPLSSLPPWADRLSTFLPGRYAVEVIQACANGEGLRAAQFGLVALVAIGAAGCLAGSKLFRWDGEQRFAAQPGKAWVAVAFAAWAAVGVGAGMRRPGLDAPAPAEARARTIGAPDGAVPLPPAQEDGETPDAAAPRAPAPRSEPDTPSAELAPQSVSPPPAAPVPEPAAEDTPPPPVSTPRRAPEREPPAATPPPAPEEKVLVPGAPARWQDVTIADVERDLTFDRLPPDSGVVTPIGGYGQEPDPDVSAELAALAAALPSWPPAQVADPVQRTRNLLFVAAVPDVLQTAIEAYLPSIVFDDIQRRTSRTELIQVLYWIAISPEGGTIPAAEDFLALGFRGVPGDQEELRNRAAIYGVKLLGRLTGHIQ
jgi:hypothetical protein